MIDEEKKYDYEAMLYLGETINYQNIYIKSLKYRQIVKDIGLSKALRMMNLSSISRKKFKDIDDTISLFDLVMLSEINELFLEFLNTFIEFDSVEYGEKTRSLYLTHGNEIGILNSSNFEEFLEVFRLAYCIDVEKEEEIQCDDEELLAILKRLEEEKAKVDKAMRKDVKITINSMVEAVSNKHPSLSCLNIGECTIYQIRRNLIRLYQIDANIYIHTGACMGNVTKDTRLEEYNWAKELD